MAEIDSSSPVSIHRHGERTQKWLGKVVLILFFPVLVFVGWLISESESGKIGFRPEVNEGPVIELSEYDGPLQPEWILTNQLHWQEIEAKLEELGEELRLEELENVPE